MTAVEHLAVTHLKNRAAMITTQDIYIQPAKDEMPPAGNISASIELLMHPSNKASFLRVYLCVLEIILVIKQQMANKSDRNTHRNRI